MRIFSVFYLTVMCRTSFHPPFGRAFNLAWLPPTVHSNCSEAVCLAARTFAIGLRSIVIFVKYREVPTRTILPNFIGNCRDGVVSAFWQRHGQERERGSVCRGSVCRGSVRQASSECFDLIIRANQNNSPGQPKEPLCVSTAVRYNYYVQSVAIERDWMRVPNLKIWSAR